MAKMTIDHIDMIMALVIWRLMISLDKWLYIDTSMILHNSDYGIKTVWDVSCKKLMARLRLNFEIIGNFRNFQKKNIILFSVKNDT